MVMILFLLMFKIDYDDTIVDTFDMIEVNHYHNEWGAANTKQTCEVSNTVAAFTPPGSELFSIRQ